MRIVPTPSLSNKIATGLDMGITLAVEHVGMTFKLPFWHPVMLGSVAGITWALFKWKDEITHAFINTLEPINRINQPSYRKSQPIVIFDKCRQMLEVKTVKPKHKGQPILLVDQDKAN
jgi:hypothetical protein